MSELIETQKVKVVELYEWTPKQLSNPTQTPKIGHQGPKNQNDPEIKQKSISELKKTYKMRVVQLHEQTVFEPFPICKNSPLGKKNSKITTKLSQNQMSELKVTQKMRVVQLHEQTSKKILNPSQPRNSLLGLQKVKNDPKIEPKLNVRIERSKENESYSTT